MLKEHKKLTANLWTKKDDAQNEHSKAVEDEGDSLVKKKHIENDLSKLKSQIPPKSRNRESPITGWAFLVFYFPIIDVAPMWSL